MSRRDVELGGRLRECDLIGPGIDSEKEITLPHDVAVLEKYPSECAAYLRAQLHLRDRRQLTKEAQLCAEVLYQSAHHYFRECRWTVLPELRIAPRKYLLHPPTSAINARPAATHSLADARLLVFRPMRSAWSGPSSVSVSVSVSVAISLVLPIYCSSHLHNLNQRRSM